MANYDFQEEVGTKIRTMIYFKILSETRENGKSRKVLSGFDLNGKTYTGIGIFDDTMTQRAIRVKESDTQIFFTEDGSQYFITEDGQNTFTTE